MKIMTGLNIYNLSDGDRWLAWDDDSYEGGLPLGKGSTPQLAIDDLKEQLGEQRGNNDDE